MYVYVVLRLFVIFIDLSILSDGDALFLHVISTYNLNTLRDDITAS